MPYIPSNRRVYYDPGIEHIVDEMLLQNNDDQVKGELNYCIYKIISTYIKARGLKYFRLQDFIFGVLGACQAELVEKLLKPYEKKKCKENGDI